MTDVPPNIAAFNAFCLTLFARLYDKFPAGLDFDPGTLAVELTSDDDSQQAWDVIASAGNAVRWLEDEGFIRVKHGTTIDGRFHGVVLTMKAMAVLGSTPAALEAGAKREPIIDRVRRLVGGRIDRAATDGAKALVEDVFATAVSYAMTSGGAGIST